MSKIIESANLPEGKKVFLKEGIFGYYVVHPTKNEDGSTNWINLLVGGWGNLFKLLFILLIVFSFIYGANEMIKSCKDFAANPCKYIKTDCSNYQDLVYYSNNSVPKLNFSRMVI